MEITIVKNNNTEFLTVAGVTFSTADYKGDKFSREVQRKTTYIEIDNDQAQKAVDFGLKVYPSKDANGNPDGGTILVVPFSKTTTVYDLTNMQKYRKDFDATQPNFKAEGATLAITKSEYKGNDFARVSAIKIVPANVKTFSVDYFGDDEAFSTIEDAKAEKPQLIEGE